MVAIEFDGTNKRINIITQTNEFNVEIDIKRDLYSEWKRWAIVNNNLKFLESFFAVGGEDKGGGKFVGSVFFIANGWTVAPILEEDNVTITFIGEILPEVAGDPIFNYSSISPAQRLQIVRETPNYSEMIETGGGSGLTAAQVWNFGNRTLTTSVGGGLTPEEHEQLMKTLTKNQFIGLK